MTERKIYCSFCGKSETEVAKIVGESCGATICDGCVSACCEILYGEIEVIKFKRIDDCTLDLPKRAHAGDAGLDLCNAGGDVYIYHGQTKKIGAGFAVRVPEGHVGLIFPRSGLATKEGLVLANVVGVIDHGYTGEIIVALKNTSNDERMVAAGARIAQLVIVPCLVGDAVEVSALSETDRGAGAFGSSGK